MLKRAALLAFSLSVACAAALSATEAAPAAREFVMADAQQSVSLDPLHTITSFESQFYTAIYEGLIVCNPQTLEPEPGMARRWESSDGGRVWTFTLRPDARWSNGDRVTARDFAESWLRMIEPSNNAEYSVFFDVIKGARAYRTGASRSAAGIGITAVSDTVLKVELEHPAAHFLKLLTHISFLPVHASLRRSTGWENASTVIGNGPFVIVSRSGSEILLEKNPRYWDADNLEVDRLRIRFMDDSDAATDGYITGRIQWVTSSLINGSRLRESDAMEVYPLFSTTYFFFSGGHAPWSDWRVRRGLALLLPWDQVRSKDPFDFPSALLVPSIPNYPVVKGIDAQQVEEGKRLLAAAGFPDGVGLPPVVVKLSRDREEMKAIVKVMADAWKASIGLEVQVREVDAAAYLAESRKNDGTLAVSGWTGDYADPLTFLQMWMTGSNLNDARFSDPDYDTAVNDAMSLMDNAKRYKRLADAEGILLEKAAILPLRHSAAINLINTNAIGGWYSNPLDIHPFKFLSFKAMATPPGIVMAQRGTPR
jgi:oligopeptide transport system substrate-binding protein